MLNVGHSEKEDITNCKIENLDRYKEFFEDSKWDWLIEMFIKESYHLHSLTQNPQLLTCLNIGVSILKTVFWDDDDYFNENCPTCSNSFRSFAKGLKRQMILINNTNLIWKITGDIMNENNPPMMLPNYYIYSEKALKAQAAENNGYDICAKTKKKYRFKKCRKVYIS